MSDHRARRWRERTFGDRVAAVSYNAAVDALDVDFGEADTYDLDEVIEDIFVFFDDKESGRLLGVEALSPGLGRSDAWRSVLTDYVGPTVMRAYLDAARAARSVTRNEIRVPEDEWIQLRSHTWPVAHRALRAKQGLSALSTEPRTGLRAIGTWLDGVVSQANFALGLRTVDEVIDLPPVNLELPSAFARQCGVDAICFASFLSKTRLQLRLDVLPEREPELEAISARPPSTRAHFERRGREAVAELELLEPADASRNIVVHFSRAARM